MKSASDIARWARRAACGRMNARSSAVTARRRARLSRSASWFSAMCSVMSFNSARIVDASVGWDLVADLLKGRRSELLASGRKCHDDPLRRGRSVDAWHAPDCNPVTKARGRPERRRKKGARERGAPRSRSPSHQRPSVRLRIDVTRAGRADCAARPRRDGSSRPARRTGSFSPTGCRPPGLCRAGL